VSGAPGLLAGLLVIALVTAAGARAAAWFAPDWAARAPRAARWALGWLLGAVLVATVLLVAMMAGVPLAPAAAALGVAALAGPAVRRGAGGRTPDPPARLPRAGVALLAVPIGLTAWVLLAEGPAFVDARTIWMLEARVFALDGGFDGSDFARWEDPHDRRAYPPLVPILGALAHLAAGGPHDGAAKLVFVAFALALAVLVTTTLARRLSPWTALALGCAFVLCRQTFTLSVWAAADLPLAAFATGAWVVLDLGERLDRGRCALAGLLLAGAVLYEGAVVLGTSAVGVALAGRRPRALARLVVPGLAVGAAWWTFTRAFGLGNHLQAGRPSTIEPGPRIAAVTEAFAARLADPGWSFVGAAFVVVLGAWTLGRARPRPAPALFVLLQGCAYAAIYVFVVDDVAWFVRTSLDRVLYHVFPVAFLLVALAGFERAGAAAGARTPLKSAAAGDR